MRKYIKVRIKDNAKEAYIGYMIHSCHSSYCDRYVKIMERLAGRVVEADMEYTFPTSYNIVDPDNPNNIISVQKLFCEEIE